MNSLDECLLKALPLPIVVLDSNTNLYRVSDISTKETIYNAQENMEEFEPGTLMYKRFEHIAKIPEGTYDIDLSSVHWYSLNRYHPLYYGGEENIKNNKSVALKYKLIKDIKLIDLEEFLVKIKINDYHQLSDSFNNLKECLLNNKSILYCVDGWVSRDDPAEKWLEIALFRPYEVIKSEHKRIEYNTEELNLFKKLLVNNHNEYPFWNEDLMKICKHTINEGDLIINNIKCEIKYF